jgi:hypothetical protein
MVHCGTIFLEMDKKWTSKLNALKPFYFAKGDISFEDDVCRLLWAVAFSGKYT